jgi:hypothetical protein
MDTSTKTQPKLPKRLHFQLIASENFGLENASPVRDQNGCADLVLAKSFETRADCISSSC